MDYRIIENITIVILTGEFILAMLGMIWFVNKLHKDIKNDEKARNNS